MSIGESVAIVSFIIGELSIGVVEGVLWQAVSNIVVANIYITIILT